MVSILVEFSADEMERTCVCARWRADTWVCPYG